MEQREIIVDKRKYKLINSDILVNIVLPFEGVEKYCGTWANSQDDIDFLHDFKSATKCTMCYAGVELKSFLSKSFANMTFSFSSEIKDCFNIVLSSKKYEGKNCDFTISKIEKGIKISAENRTGVLFGVYEFLRIQGWRWLTFENDGERLKDSLSGLLIPTKKYIFKYNTPLGRGFEFEGTLKISEPILVWMSRNGMNLAGYDPFTEKIAGKLGLILKAGGHVFEKLLDPERFMPSGKTVWDEHLEWYGLLGKEGWEKNKDWFLPYMYGVKCKETARLVQFCMTQDSLLEYLSQEMLNLIMTKWHGADRIDVWTFDAFGGSCSCENCKKIGNGSDLFLHFLSYLRDYLDRAYKEKRLDHKVQLVGISYDGTDTIEPPKNAIPKNLINSGDYMIFCDIRRCYMHDFNDKKCSYNKVYSDALEGWLKIKERMPIMIFEYYNVSRLEDMSLLFTNRIVKDLRYYFNSGVKGFTYMHLPMLNWGVRTLTQCLLARLSFDKNINVNKFLDEYFSLRYGESAKNIKTAYRYIERASASCLNWRSWSKYSVLCNLTYNWKGDIPQSPLQVDDHFSDVNQLILDGKNAVNLYKKALKIIDKELKAEKERIAKNLIIDIKIATNPVEQQQKALRFNRERALIDDKFGVNYTLKMYQLIVAIVEYYMALYNKDKVSENELYNKIVKLSNDGEMMIVPVTYTTQSYKIECRDMLTRSQLKETVRNIISQKLKRDKNIK